MSLEPTEAPLPGVGVRYAFATAHGGRVGFRFPPRARSSGGRSARPDRLERGDVLVAVGRLGSTGEGA
jgi:hypothetical protein